MVRKPLSMSHLKSHCSGGPAVGLAPIVPGESTTRIALLDLDSHKGATSWEDMRACGLRIADALRERGLAPIPFRSSGGKGIHLVLLWDEPQDAYSIRHYLTQCLIDHALRNGTGGLKAGEVEVFPKQACVPADGFGNMFVLPLSGESLPLEPHSFDLLGYDYAEDMKAWPHSAPVPVLDHPTVQAYSSAATSATSLAELRSALRAIPNGGSQELDYDSWRNVIFGIHHESQGSDEGLALAHEFSARSSKYDAEFLDTRVWPHIRSDRSGVLVTGRSIYSRASEHGWQENVLDDFVSLDTESGAGEAEGSRDSAEPGASPAARPASTNFHFYLDDEFTRRPAPEWIVKGLIPRAELVAVFGQSTTGKSFLTLDVGACVQRGVPWRNLKVKRGEVAYIAAEGAGGFRNRVLAYQRHHDLERIGMHVLPAAPNLLQVDQVRQLATAVNAIGGVVLVIVDTLAQVTPGADENSAEDMGLLISSCKAMHRLTGATVLLVHHAGKDPSKGMRGSSAFLAACDAVIEVAREGEQRIATVAKQKDGADGAAYPFRLQVIPVGMDEDGDVIDSCVLEHQEAAQVLTKGPRGKNEKALLDALDDLLGLADGDAVGVGEVLDQALLAIPQDPTKRDQRRGSLMRAIDGLVAGRQLELVDGKLRRGER